MGRWRFRGRVNDIPLKTKFMLIYLIGVLLPILVINLVFMGRMTDFIKEREKQNLEISMERARKDILDFIDGGVAVSHALNTDKTLYEKMDRIYSGPVDFYETFDEQLRNRVTSYIPVNNQILRIGIYTTNPTIVPGGNYHMINDEVKGSEWYRIWSSSSDPVVVAAYRASQATNRANTEPYFSVIEKMDYYDSYNTFDKLLRIDIDLSKIYDVIVRERDYLDLYLVNGNDEIIVSADSGYRQDTSVGYPKLELSAEDREKGVESVVIGNAKYVKGWRLIGIPQGTRLSKAMFDMRLFVGMLVAAITLFTSIFIFVMLRSYHYRVNKLARHMARIRDERFEPIVMAEGRDEIGALIRSFNTMAQKIHSLIHEVYKLEIRQKNLEVEHLRTELSALHSQVNPHFLFNTLNALYVVCVKNGYTDVASVIRDLSLLMRQILGRGDDLIPLREELQFTSMYLQIEKFRFGDLFEYAFEVDPAVREMRIPRLSVQLLVENACKHGLQARRDNRKVAVTAKQEEGALVIAVADNGIGMEEEKLRQVMDTARSDSAGNEHVGIRNVYKRLELYYRGMAAFRIVSSPGEGTTVEIRIPLKLLMEERSREG